MRRIDRQRIPAAAGGLRRPTAPMRSGSKGLGFSRQPWKRRLTDVVAAGDGAVRVTGTFGLGDARGGADRACGSAGTGTRTRRNSSMRARIIAKSSAARGADHGFLPFALFASLSFERRSTIWKIGLIWRVTGCYGKCPPPGLPPAATTCRNQPRRIFGLLPELCCHIPRKFYSTITCR